MKRICRFWVFILLSMLLSACEKSGVDFNFTEPIENKPINEVFDPIDHDLLDAFGEDHIHFGPVPPSLDGISFELQGLDILYYKKLIDNDGVIIEHSGNSGYDGSTNYHHFFTDNTSSYTKHRFQTKDPNANIYTRENDIVYVIGHDNSFTAYYIEQVTDEGSGNPTNAIIISGTLVYDNNNQFLGVKDYRIGKKILDYEYPPMQAYAKGSIFIMQQHNPLAPASNWDHSINE